MFISSLAALVLASASTVAPATTVLPVHSGLAAKQLDSRVTLTLANTSNRFIDVNIAGHVYEVAAHQSLHVKGPVGTSVIAASRTTEYNRGDLMTTLTPESNRQTVTVR